jgi:hypothetical protein
MLTQLALNNPAFGYCMEGSLNVEVPGVPPSKVHSQPTLGSELPVLNSLKLTELPLQMMTDGV